jgi:hypothetical protein
MPYLGEHDVPRLNGRTAPDVAVVAGAADHQHRNGRIDGGYGSHVRDTRPTFHGRHRAERLSDNQNA